MFPNRKPTPAKASELVKLLELAIREYGDLPVFARAGQGEGPGERSQSGPVFCVVNGGEGATARIEILAYNKAPAWLTAPKKADG